MFWMAQKKELGNINLDIVKITKHFPLSFSFLKKNEKKTS